MVEIRPATQKDVEAFYGKLPVFTMRGVVGTKDGEILGLGGTYKYQGNTVVFCEIKESAKQYRKSILKAAKMVINSIKDKRVFAFCDTGQSTAPAFLEHLGFMCVNEELNIYCREVE